MDKWDGINRRRGIRAQFPYTIHIHPSGGKPISTYTEDIASGGVRVVIQQKLDLGSLADIKIYIGNDFIRCKGKIVWIKEKTSSVLDGILFYNAGIEFSDIKPADAQILEQCARDLEAKQKNKGKR